MRIHRIILSFVIFLLVPGVHAAEVRSISREVKSELDGETIWTVHVKCAGISEERSIERTDSSRKWCSEDLPTMCSRKKVKAANNVCGSHFERLVGEYRVEKAKQEAEAN
ncbi:hypothetical protein GCM10008090_12700 [Arenicella chitinivorans]|uniref:Uncharacterized protein n=1 Tax=Arenicella chitinivorans TaxID=1329800 RepID=A0A918RP89_9GAMM|nr:hypothetical protein [Arenicella chitinivorans]GHA04729.1 hypothetical protein GCM10008090_12700 [Arenicella chitinivorans]